MLRQVGSAVSSAVLVGGQALNFWAERYRGVSDLAREGPFTSKDVDFCGKREAAVAFAQRLDGRAELPAIDDPSPNTAMVRFIDAGGVERVIDFIGQPFGMEADDIHRTAIPFDVLDEHGGVACHVRIMHPVRCMEKTLSTSSSCTASCVTRFGRDPECAVDPLREGTRQVDVLVDTLCADKIDDGEQPEHAINGTLSINRVVDQIVQFSDEVTDP